MQSSPFLILAIFGFPLNTPLPTRHARSPLTTAQRAPCQKRGFGAARYQVAREARFRATLNRRFTRFEEVISLLYNADSWQPKNYASNQSARVCIANCARFFILAIFGFPLNTPLPTRHARSPLTTAQSALVEERGHSTRALPYLAQTRLGEM